MKPVRMETLISFSGIDGAGKSTQIASLRDSLSSRGWKVAQIAFWDDAAVFARFRAGVTLRVLPTQPKSAEEPPLRRDKNVSAWYLTLIRSVFYALDALRLRAVVARTAKSGTDFIILDRWTYDQLVHIKSRTRFARAYIRIVFALAPSPDLPLLLDASPDDAFRRKPEYPLAFLHEYRQAFLALKEFVPKLQIISHGPIDEVRHRILATVLSNSCENLAKSGVGEPRTKLISNSP